MKYLEIFDTGYEFKGKDGKNYKLASLSLLEFSKFVRWVQYKPYRDALDGELPEIKCDEILEECKRGKVIERVLPDGWIEDEDLEVADEDLVEKEFDIAITSSVVKQMMLDPEGILKIIFISLTINHPEVNEKNAGKIIGFKEFAELQDELFRRISSDVDIDEEDSVKNEKSPDQ